MARFTPHSVRSGLTVALLFAGLAVIPSVSLAARDERKPDQSTKQQPAARGEQKAPDTAVIRPGQGRAVAQDQAARGVSRQATPAVVPQQRQPVAPVATQREQRQQATRQVERPASQSQRTDQGRQSQPQQNAAPQAQANPQPYQPRGRQNANPQPYQPPQIQRGRQATGDRNAQPQIQRRQQASGNQVYAQPKVQRGQGNAQSPYQLYRPAKAATPVAEGSTQQPRIQRGRTPAVDQAAQQPQIQRGRQAGDAGQPYQQPKKAAPASSRASANRLNRSGVTESPTIQRGAGTATAQSARNSATAMPKVNRGVANRTPQAGSAARADSQAVTRPAVPRAQRSFQVPKAQFRGPESDQQVRIVRKDEPQRLQTQLRDRIREQNRSLGNWNSKVRPAHDVVGNVVPKDTLLLNRTNITNSNVTINYTNIVNYYGTPGFGYAFRPHYFDNDLVVVGGHHHHRNTAIFLNFYYPFYFSDPYFAGFWYDGYYPSVYAYVGWAPGWIYPTRVYYAPAEYYYAPATPYRYYASYSLDYSGLNSALRDVQRAWLDSDIGPLSAHLTDQLDVRVYFDGEYSYTTTTDDFYQMTLDTLATTQTVAMDFDDPIWISSYEVFVTGRQSLYDPDGEEHTIYVSFRLRHLSTGWYLVAIGTSRNPIEHQYSDFRYEN